MKKIKVALSLILAIALISIMVLPAFAAGASNTCDCGHAPVIQVRGIGEKLYLGEVADENEIFSSDRIVDSILPVIPQLAEFLGDTTRVDLLLGAAKTAVYDIFGPVMYNNNLQRLINLDAEGNEIDEPISIVVDSHTEPVEDYMNFNVSLTEEEKLAKALYEELGDDHVYLFTYDWTANPVDIAADLKDFIEEVKKQSGHNKVSINAESLGGAIVNLYLSKYGQGSIENLVMANSAFNGLEMMAQLFTGNVDIDGTALSYLITQELLGNADYRELAVFASVFEEVAKIADELMANPTFKQMMYDEIFVPVFGYIPSFWSLVPTYKYDGHDNIVFDEAKDYIFGEDTGFLFFETREKAGGNLLFAVNTIRNASAESDKIVDKLLNGYKKSGKKYPAINSYANVTNYNRFIAPVTPSANWNSDGVIEAYNASGFATIADMGLTLGENYIQAELKDVANYVSPDNVVDASTCQAPNNTWFIKNLGHVKYDANDGTADFYVWLLTATEKQDINTDENYPQFLYYDTTINQLMTFDEHENGGIISGLPGIDMDGIEDAIDQLLAGLESLGVNLDDLDFSNLNLDSILGLLGSFDLSMITDLLGSIDIMGLLGSFDLGGILDMIMGLLGLGGGSETPEDPSTPDDGLNWGDDEPTTEAPEEPSTEAPEEPSTDVPEEPSTNAPVTTPDSNTGNSNVGSSNVIRVPVQQTTGITYSGTPTFSIGSTPWVILFAVAAVIAGILIIKL